jgi:hypothetical protein
MRNDYVPGADAALRLWLAGFKTSIATNGPTLGFTAQQVTDAQAWADAIIAAIDNAKQKSDEATAATANKETAKGVNLKSIRDMIAVAKKSAAYTEAIGKALGAVGTTSTIDTETIKPNLTAATSVAGVTLKFNKQGTDGVNIYTKRGAETEFKFLARDTQSPYVDTRDNLGATSAEERQYYAIYILVDDEVGQPSDTVTISV